MPGSVALKKITLIQISLTPEKNFPTFPSPVTKSAFLVSDPGLLSPAMSPDSSPSWLWVLQWTSFDLGRLPLFYLWDHKLDLFLFTNDLTHPGFAPTKPYIISGRAVIKQTYEGAKLYTQELLTFNLFNTVLNLTHCIILDGS
jgi:hypothetical protein